MSDASESSYSSLTSGVSASLFCSTGASLSVAFSGSSAVSDEVGLGMPL